MATDPEVRSVKRSKVVAATKKSTSQTRTRSSLFAPYRAIGLVSPTDVPFVSLPLGRETFQITTCIGRSLQTYDLKRGLHLIFITSPQTPGPITATAVWERRVLAAWKSQDDAAVWVYQRGKKVGELEMPHKGKLDPILSLSVFGSWIIGCCKSKLEIWKSGDHTHYSTLSARSTGGSSKFSGPVVTMPTHLNKIFVGKEDGNVEIWNVRTGKLIYSLLPPRADCGPITALQPAPALNLLATAYENGLVTIRNVKTDRVLITFKASQGSSLAVSSISFRTDDLGAGEDGQKPGVMATASRGSGDVTFWDLNLGGRRTGTLRGAHLPPSLSGNVPGGISRLEFLPGQSVLVTSGLDNALKTWIFDAMPFSPIPRVLHSRGGHAAPVSTLKFLPSNADGADAEGKWLMSASSDRSLWAWSLRRDAQSSELSQGAIRKKAKTAGLLASTADLSSRGTTLEDLKAPKITCMACSLNRDGGMGTLPGASSIWSNETLSNSKGKKNGAQAHGTDLSGWESVLTGHENDKFARTWFWGRKRAGRWKFPTSDNTSVSSVGISSCGTYALVGSTGGAIDMFNLQSGIHRQRFPVKLTEIQAKRLEIEKQHLPWRVDENEKNQKYTRGEGKHKKAVMGIEVDSLNKTVISCGKDGLLKFWDMMTGILLHELDWSLTSITAMRFHRPSDLIALACDDSSVRVVDISTRRLVRELWGAKGKILDFCFSNDGRWIVSIASDRTVRVHDLATGHLIESMRFKSQPTAIGFSPQGEFLATAHEDGVGINLWTNKSLFAHVRLGRREVEDVVEMEQSPTASGEGGKSLLDGMGTGEVQKDEDEEEEIAEEEVDQLSSDLLTLSLVPKSKWQTLLNLDIIRERNKPKEAPKKPQSAPFFLPSIHGLAPDGSSSTSANAITNGVGSLQQTISVQEAPKSKLSTIQDPAASSTTTFTTLLRDFYRDASMADPNPLFTFLATLPPSTIDLYIRTLDPSPPYLEPISFINALTGRLDQRRDYELVQTYMAVFLRCHSSLVVESEEVRSALRKWREKSEEEGKRVGEMVGYVKGVVGWVGGVI